DRTVAPPPRRTTEDPRCVQLLQRPGRAHQEPHLPGTTHRVPTPTILGIEQRHRAGQARTRVVAARPGQFEEFTVPTRGTVEGRTDRHRSRLTRHTRPLRATGTLGNLTPGNPVQRKTLPGTNTAHHFHRILRTRRQRTVQTHVEGDPVPVAAAGTYPYRIHAQRGWCGCGGHPQPVVDRVVGLYARPARSLGNHVHRRVLDDLLVAGDPRQWRPTVHSVPSDNTNTSSHLSLSPCLPCTSTARATPQVNSPPADTGAENSRTVRGELRRRSAKRARASASSCANTCPCTVMSSPVTFTCSISAWAGERRTCSCRCPLAERVGRISARCLVWAGSNGYPFWWISTSATGVVRSPSGPTSTRWTCQARGARCSRPGSRTTVPSWSGTKVICSLGLVNSTRVGGVVNSRATTPFPAVAHTRQDGSASVLGAGARSASAPAPVAGPGWPLTVVERALGTVASVFGARTLLSACFGGKDIDPGSALASISSSNSSSCMRTTCAGSKRSEFFRAASAMERRFVSLPMSSARPEAMPDTERLGTRM